MLPYCSSRSIVLTNSRCLLSGTMGATLSTHIALKPRWTKAMNNAHLSWCLRWKGDKTNRNRKWRWPEPCNCNRIASTWTRQKCVKSACVNRKMPPCERTMEADVHPTTLDYDYYFRTSILYPCCVRPSVLTMYCYNVGTTADHSCIHVIYLLIWTTSTLTTYDLTTDFNPFHQVSNLRGGAGHPFRCHR